jgi:hypothetical protein
MTYIQKTLSDVDVLPRVQLTPAQAQWQSVLFAQPPQPSASAPSRSSCRSEGGGGAGSSVSGHSAHTGLKAAPAKHRTGHQLDGEALAGQPTDHPRSLPAMLQLVESTYRRLLACLTSSTCDVLLPCKREVAASAT